MSEDLREHIKAALAEFARPNVSLRSAALQFFAKLGYQSDRTVEIPKSDPNAFLDLFAKDSKFDPARALFPDWKSVDLLFQLTDQEIRRELSLFPETSIQRSQLKSYVFIGIELTGKSSINGNYARGKLTALARQINRIFPMPVMVLMKHLADRRPVVSIAVINRRRNKIHEDKDVMEKTTIIRDISITDPHRGHLDILASFAFENLVHPQRFPINNFDALHAAWEEIFNVELLNKRFYKELSNWYFWALDQVEFPSDLEPDRDKRNATGLIRLLTRLIFCWFLKEKDGLIPDKLFHPSDLAMLLNGFDPESETSSTYYLAILQNLFFATLNQRMGKDSSGKPYRRFVTEEKYQGRNKEHGVTTLYRYPELFRDRDSAIAEFGDIPFLNGGLFECLDREDPENKNRMLRLDGFTTDGERPHVPDRLFFDSGETADLSKVYGDKKRKAERVTGLITILNRYKFTIVENTPIDQEIALDPELLGKVFENLLASYNEETKTTARKQTGSFYTPRPIVDYMVDESLKAHLTRSLVEKARMKESDAKEGLDILFAYTEKEHAFNSSEVDALIAAIDEVKILDPACGSGAFPMGVLHKLVYILGKLDPDNERWKQTQLSKLDSPPMREELERAFADNNDDYGRKLYLIENCLYGVDIQPVAIQITKLRFFISLVCDQKTNRDKSKNHGIRPLPNLETKFVAADTLIGLPISDKDLFIEYLIAPIEKEIEDAYHGHFTIQRRDQKLALQKKIKSLRLKLADTLASSLGSAYSAKAKHIAEWDPFDPQSTADFFDPHWMFGQALKNGFDIVIGNPPYLRIQGIQQTNPKAAEYYKQNYDSATGSFDLYVIFMERGMQLIGENGILNFINPDKWVSASFGRGIRSYAIAKQNVHKLISFGAHQVFSACTYSSLLWMGRSPAMEVEYAQVAPEESKTVTLEDELAKLEPSAFTRIRLDSLTDEPWILAAGNGGGVISAIQAHQRTTGQVFAKMFQGIASSKDSVYFLKDAEDHGSIWEAQSPELGERIAIEKGLVRPLLMGDQVHRYEPIRTNKVVLFPYWLREESAELMKPNEIEARFPLGWRYLLRCSDVLKGRERGRLLGDPHWYRYIYPKNQKLFGQPKLLAPDISLGGNFTLDLNGEYYTTTTLYGYIKHDKVWESYEFLLAVMNSKVLWFYLKTSGSVLANGYFRYKPAYLQNFSIPEVSEKTEATISRLVRCMLTAKANGTSAGPIAFLEDLIDACVLECYFREHMAERDLLFLDTVAPLLASYDSAASEVQQRDFLTHLHQTLNAPSHPIRNRLLRLTADSPDLLAIIKQEGRV